MLVRLETFWIRFFYGEIFTASHPYYTNLPTAHLVAWGEGYASVLMGNVVDMFSFPLFHGTFPEWLPIWGGEDFTFFSAIFNFADACISVGVVVLFLFYRNDFNSTNTTPSATKTTENIAEKHCKCTKNQRRINNNNVYTETQQNCYMRGQKICILLAFVLVSCKPTVPSTYIQPGEMEDLLYDYHVAMSVASSKKCYSRTTRGIQTGCV